MSRTQVERIVRSALRATIERNGPAVILSAAGDVDANRDAWQQLVRDTAATVISPGPLVVDVRGLDFLGGCAFRVLAEEANRCRSRGVSLRVVTQQPIVAHIVAACRLGTVLPICPTIEMALRRESQ